MHSLLFASPCCEWQQSHLSCNQTACPLTDRVICPITGRQAMKYAFAQTKNHARTHARTHAHEQSQTCSPSRQLKHLQPPHSRMYSLSLENSYPTPKYTHSRMNIRTHVCTKTTHTHRQIRARTHAQTMPSLISFLPIAALISSSQSNTAAFPLNISPSFPVILATQPPGAMFPYRI